MINQPMQFILSCYTICTQVEIIIFRDLLIQFRIIHFMQKSLSKEFFKRSNRNQYLMYPMSSRKDLQDDILKETTHIEQGKQQSLESLKNKLLTARQQKYITNLPQIPLTATPFQALSQLKQTQQQYDMMKKRLQVLKLKDQKNTHQHQLNNRKLLLHNSIQKLSSLQKQRLQQHKYQTQEKRQQQRLINLQEKIVREKNIEHMAEALHQNKFRDYQQRKAEAEQNEKRRKDYEEFSKKINQQKVVKIKELQSMSRVSLENYARHKNLQFRDKKIRESDMLRTRKSQRDEQIRKMLQLELQMVEKQSKSRVMMESSTQRLKSVLNPQKGLQKSRIIKQSARQQHKLKSRQSQNEADIINQLDMTTQQPSFKSESNEYKGFSLPEIKKVRRYM